MQDSVFCFACRHFTATSGYVEPKFVAIGFNDWKKLGVKLSKHYESDSHLEAVERWSAAKQSDIAGNVLNQVDNQFHECVLRNRQAISTLVRAVLFCAMQSIALRGHRESNKASGAGEQCINRGNYVELITLLETEIQKLLNSCANCHAMHSTRVGNHRMI